MPKRPSFRFLLMVAVLLAAPVSAAAQNNIAILGIRSAEGDDDFARDLTNALRHAASGVREWSLSAGEVTLDQMLLTHGCEEPDEACLTQIAQSLSVNRVIYGEIHRTSSGRNYDFALDLHLFSAASHQREHSVTDTIPRRSRSAEALRPLATRYLTELQGAPRAGTLRIHVNVPGAEVFIDDSSVGTADDEGNLVVNDVQAGSRNVRVVAAGHQSFRSTVSVEPFGEATFEAELHAGSDGGGVSGELIAGISFLVVAAALAGGWIASWFYVTQDLQTDPAYQQYRQDASRFAVDQGITSDPVNDFDVCQQAQGDNRNLMYMSGGSTFLGTDPTIANRAKAVCDEAQTFEVMEFVFGFTALAAAGVGVFFLVLGATSSSPAPAQSLRLTPSFGPHHAYLGLAGSF